MFELKTNAEKYSSDIADEIRLFTAFESDISVELSVSDFLRCRVEFDGEVREYSQKAPEGDELTVKRLTKRFLKLSVYSALSSRYGDLPWGSLTGVRPTKLAYEWLKRNEGSGLQKYLTETFFVSEKKARTLSEIISAQSPYIRDLENSVNLYVHVPFCDGRCSYCSFPSADINKNAALIDDYVSCLCTEIRSVKEIIAAEGRDILSIYVGGGTPSALSEEHIAKILRAIDVGGREFTFEAGRADSITKSKLRVIKEGGANRICINPQTLNDATLAAIGRRHTAEQFYKAYDEAQNAGFIINTDIIAGLTGETFDDFRRTADGIYALHPHNVTVHTLSRKRGSELQEQQLHCADIEKMSEYAYDAFTKTYRPYYLYRQKNMLGNLENIGFSLAGYECVNNITVMEELVPVYACGAGSISKKITNGVITRHASPKDVRLYIEEFGERFRRKSEFFRG